jgi:putative ABC transport system substrate-binding protein
LYNLHEDPVSVKVLPVLRKVAATSRLKLVEKPVRLLTAAEQAVSLTSSETTDGIFIVCTSFFRDLSKIADISRAKKIALYGCSAREVADYGALLTYAPDFYYLQYRAAWYVNQILKGKRPQDLPVETPSKFELVINLKVAKEIGLTIPPLVLIRADKVIQ